MHREVQLWLSQEMHVMFDLVRIVFFRGRIGQDYPYRPACKDQAGSREWLHLQTSSRAHSTTFFRGNTGKLSARRRSQPFRRYNLFNMSWCRSMPYPSFGPTRGHTDVYLWSIGHVSAGKWDVLASKLPASPILVVLINYFTSIHPSQPAWLCQNMDI